MKEDTMALKPFTIFGSSFPKDKEYTQVREYIIASYAANILVGSYNNIISRI